MWTFQWKICKRIKGKKIIQNKKIFLWFDTYVSSTVRCERYIRFADECRYWDKWKPSTLKPAAYTYLSQYWIEFLTSITYLSFYFRANFFRSNTKVHRSVFLLLQSFFSTSKSFKMYIMHLNVYKLKNLDDFLFFFFKFIFN